MKRLLFLFISFFFIGVLMAVQSPTPDPSFWTDAMTLITQIVMAIVSFIALLKENFSKSLSLVFGGSLAIANGVLPEAIPTDPNAISNVLQVLSTIIISIFSLIKFFKSNSKN